jgi:hypothetical protein
MTIFPIDGIVSGAYRSLNERGDIEMTDRYAKDCSESLFNSIYESLYSMASRQNEAAYIAAKRKKDYRPGGHQDALNDFCHGRMTVASALEYCRIEGMYA